MKKRAKFGVGLIAAPVLVATVVVATAPPSGALIHEMIGASCRSGGEDVEPRGQAGGSNGNSLVRALQATGVISSIDVTETEVTINFDLDRPNAKFVSAGFAITIPEGFAPGVDLTLNPLPVLEGSTFPAYVNCANLNR
jgi:hypothetical protein